jgi:uncharacterized membrane protein
MEETNTQVQPEAPKQPQAPTGAEMPPEPKALYYVLSFFISLAGIILGIIYMKKDGEENKKFGKMCLILGIVPTLVGCLCWGIMMVFGLMSGGGSYSTY